MRESRVWARYRERYGSLNPMMRTEWAAGIISSTIANVNRGKNTRPFSLKDFTIHFGNEPISLDEAMKSWG